MEIIILGFKWAARARDNDDTRTGHIIERDTLYNGTHYRTGHITERDTLYNKTRGRKRKEEEKPSKESYSSLL